MGTGAGTLRLIKSAIGSPADAFGGDAGGGAAGWGASEFGVPASESPKFRRSAIAELAAGAGFDTEAAADDEVRWSEAPS